MIVNYSIVKMQLFLFLLLREDMSVGAMFWHAGSLRGNLGRCFCNKSKRISSKLSNSNYYKQNQRKELEDVGKFRLDKARDEWNYRNKQKLRKLSGTHRTLDIGPEQEEWRRRIEDCRPKEVHRLLQRCIRELGTPHSAIFLYGKHIMHTHMIPNIRVKITDFCCLKIN